MNSSPTNRPGVTLSIYLSHLKHPLALLVGGLCNFLRTFVFFAVMTMLPLMVMEMEAQSFNRQGVEAAQSLLNKQGIEVMTSVGYANNVGYEGINMEPLSTLFRGEGGWGDYNIPSHYSNNNNNNYDNSHIYQPHSRHRLLQEDGDNGATTDGNNRIRALLL